MKIAEEHGTTWQAIGSGIPGSSANVIKQDPRKKDLLYVGTDRAVYVTAVGESRSSERRLLLKDRSRELGS